MAYNSKSLFLTYVVHGLWVPSVPYSRVHVEGATPLLGIAVFAAGGKEVMVEACDNSTRLCSEVPRITVLTSH